MTLQSHYPLQEDSGSTAYDHSGNGNDGTVTGATLGATGLLGGTAYSFDGTDDKVVFDNWTDIENGPPATVTAWIMTTVSDTFPAVVSNRKSTDSSDIMSIQLDGSTVRASCRDASDTIATPTASTAVNDGSFHFVAAIFGPSTTSIWVDGVQENSASTPGGSFTLDRNTVGAVRGNQSEGDYWTGEIGNVRAYDHALTPTEVQYLYDVGTTGTVYTATKTHGSSITPNLRADVTLNGEAADAYVYGSPRTASEEVKQVSLSTGSNDYTLSWSSGHTDFAVEVVADLSDVTNRVEVNKVAVII